MRELFTMWRSTRMVVLTAISAALYAASLVAFKFLSILPGVTEIRPGVALVVLCSVLFGPAGAWGAAIGNTIGDLVGGLGPGTAVGFVANFLFGLVPYKLLRAFGVEDAMRERARGVGALVLACLAASAACAATVGAGIQGLGLWPRAFLVLAPMIFLTNSLVTLGLALFLVYEVYPRVRALGLRYEDVLDAPARPRALWRTALALLAAGAIGVGLGAGFYHAATTAPPPANSLDWRIAEVVLGPIAAAVALLAVAD
jgi:energy-coupling factor transport system substrate-specific component